MADLPAGLTAALSDHYRIERELGRGGMATVYLAEDLKHHRQVALKVLRPELASMLGPERFQREIQLAARLQHPHILPVFDSGEAAGQLWYVMPYVAGESLRGRLEREPQLPLDEALQITREVAAALGHAHQQGIVHRDIKPENILLSGGHAVVADFGIARALDAAGGQKLTETGMALGTPTYMSPEQGSGDARLDGRSDLYALGVVLYEMLAGAPPFTGPTSQSIRARHAIDPIPSLRTVRTTVPASVETAITRALAKVPADRFASTAEFVVALEGRGGATAPPLPAAARSRARVVLAAVLALVVFAVGALLFRSFGRGTSANANLIAVAPFRVSAAEPVLGYLREGMIDLLAATFNGENGPRTVEARSVTGAWSRASSAQGGADPDEQESIRLAQRLGAGGLVLGSIVGSGSRLSLRAQLLDVPSGRVRGQAVAEGEQDSLSSLVDQLTAQLLGLKAGVEQGRLAGLTSTSLPAVNAYLRGKALFRRGRFGEAEQAFREAVEIDSTFAVAALALSGSVGTDGDERGMHLAWTYRNKLSPADRASAEARAGPNYPNASRLDERIAAWVAAAAANPDRAEVWYSLGDLYYHNGINVGISQADALARADQAFRRGEALDSLAESQGSPNAPEAIGHMMELATMNRDGVRARRLLAVASAADSMLDTTIMRWFVAQATGDSITLDSLRRHPVEMARQGPGPVVFTFSQWNGIGVADGEAVLRYQVAQRQVPPNLLGAVLLNGGRPREAMGHGGGNFPSRQPRARERGLILDAMFWDGDTVAASQAARVIAPYADGPLLAGPDGRSQYEDICTLEQWRLYHGRFGTVRAAIARLRRAGGNSCPALLEAWLASETRQPDVMSAIERLDSLSLGRWGSTDNLVLARLREAAGDQAGALRAIRRRGQAFGLYPAALSTFLREEGRLAALTGDTAGAIRAYEHYLALRWNPEPEIKLGVERVRGELARLVAETH